MSRNRIESIARRFRKEQGYFEFDRKELLALLPAGVRCILDVGCGAGSAWQGHPAEVHGVEFDPAQAEAARARLTSVHSGDIQKLELPFGPGYFDCIVFADVLEHLYDPWGTILKLRPLLAPGGHVLISVPNIRYYKVLEGLVLRADFSYEYSGVLDIDHVRFFARRSLRWMLDQTGFDVRVWTGVERGSGKYRFLNRCLLGALRDLLTKQYYVLAQARSDWRPAASMEPAALQSKGVV